RRPGCSEVAFRHWHLPCRFARRTRVRELGPGAGVRARSVAQTSQLPYPSAPAIDEPGSARAPLPLQMHSTRELARGVGEEPPRPPAPPAIGAPSTALDGLQHAAALRRPGSRGMGEHRAVEACQVAIVAELSRDPVEGFGPRAEARRCPGRQQSDLVGVRFHRLAETVQVLVAGVGAGHGEPLLDAAIVVDEAVMQGLPALLLDLPPR